MGIATTPSRALRAARAGIAVAGVAVAGIALGLLAGLGSLPAHAAGYPSRAVHLVVTDTAGSGVDLRSRLLAQKLSALWGQPVIVENRAGAAGSIGTSAAAHAPADGYTLLMAVSGPLTIAPYLAGAVPYDPLQDLAPITLIAASPIVLFVPASSPWKTLPALVAAARAAPGRLTAGSFGSGSASHIALEMFKSAAGVNLTHVPYKGQVAALADLVGGQIDMAFGLAVAAQSLVKAGKLATVAVASDHRSTMFPESPTFAEAGTSGVELMTWIGAMAPAGTPGPIITQLNHDFIQVLQAPEVRELLLATGSDLGGDSPEHFLATIRAEQRKFSTVIRAVGIAGD
jgi:tripartite-type tricarboxylate transporter receptor subunit TctC